MSLNKVMLIGNLGKDPEVRYTGSGTPVANFSIATTHRTNRGDKWEDQTEWHDIVAFGKLADICGQHLHKGKQVYIEGRIQTRNWTDKEGQKRYRTEIIANEMKMLGGRGEKSNHEKLDEAAEAYEGNVADDDDIPF